MQNKPALKGLFAFFVVMALLTLVARAADSLLIANVVADIPLRGALSHDAASEGIVESENAQMIWAPPALRIAQVPVKSGMQVKQGDTLALFDAQSVSDKLTESKLALDKLTNERAQLELDKPDAKEVNKTKQHKLKLEAMDMSIEKARRDMSRLDAIRSGGLQLRAPTSGIISELTAKAGKETGPDSLMRLGSSTGALTLSCKISRDEAKYVAAGDMAQVTPVGKRESERAQVVSLSQPGEDGKVEVVIALPGAPFSPGMHASVKFSRKTDGYDAVVPLSAIRSDSAGDYVLALRSKPSILGDTQMAERVPVMVLDKDATRAAVQGAMLDRDLVIKDWDKAIETNDRVRLVDEL